MSDSRNSTAAWTITLSAILLVALTVFVAVTERQSWWGLSAITYLSSSLQWSLFFLAAAFLLASLTGAVLRIPVPPWLARYAWITLPILGIALFLLREGYPLCGDGWLLVQRLNQANPPLLSNWIFGRPEPLGLSFFAILRKLTGVDGPAIYQSLSILSGVGILALFAVFARTIRFTSSQSVVLAVPLFTSASLALFSGYVENYPVLMVLWAATLFYAVAVVQTERLPFWPLLMAMPILFFWHYGSLVLFPAIGLAGCLRARKSPVSAKIFSLLLIGLSVILFLLYLVTPLSRGTRLFLPLLPQATADGYSLLSSHHIFDFIFEIFLVAPLAFFFLISACFLRRDLAKDSGMQVLSLAALLGLAAAFVFDPAFGMPLDWDLLATMLLPLNLLAGFALAKAEPSPSVRARIAGIAGVSLLLIALPSILVNSRTQLSEERFRDLLSDHPERAAYGWEILAGLMAQRGDVDKRLSCLERAADASDNPRLIKNVAVAALRFDRQERARRAVEKLRTIAPTDFVQATEYFALFLKFGFFEDAERMLPYLQKFAPPGENLQRYVSTLTRVKADSSRDTKSP